MSDEQIVQSEDSVEATTEVSGETPPEKPAEPDKLAELEKKFDAKIDEINRHWQSVKDREVKSAKREAAEYRRKAEQSDTILGTLRTNPAIRTPLAQAEQNVYAGAYRQREQADAEEQAKQAYFEQLEDYVKDLGIDANNSKLDWARDARDIHEATRRFHKSVAEIQKESVTSIKDEILKQIKTEREEAEEQKRREEGIDSIDTTTPVGGLSKKNPHKLYADGLITTDEYEKMLEK